MLPELRGLVRACLRLGPRTALLRACMATAADDHDPPRSPLELATSGADRYFHTIARAFWYMGCPRTLSCEREDYPYSFDIAGPNKARSVSVTWVKDRKYCDTLYHIECSNEMDHRDCIVFSDSATHDDVSILALLRSARTLDFILG